VGGVVAWELVCEGKKGEMGGTFGGWSFSKEEGLKFVDCQDLNARIEVGRVSVDLRVGI
jgi:hypothetical protein